MRNFVRLLQVGMSSNRGGIETYIFKQYQNLDRNKLRYDFVQTYGDGDFPFKENVENNGDKLYRAPTRHEAPIKYYWYWLNFFFKNHNKYDIVVCNVSNMYGSFFPLLAAQLFGVGVRMVHSHNTRDDDSHNFIQRCIGIFNKLLMITTVTHRVACGKMAGEFLFGKKNFTVIPVCVDSEKFAYNSCLRKRKRSYLGIENNFVIGNVARFNRQKNQLFLLDIFAEIKKYISHAVLLLVGGHDLPGDDDCFLSVRDKVHQLGLEKDVIFLGMRDDIPELMQAMDVFVLPSLFEGFPVVGIESQAAGLPTIFSDEITKEIGVTKLAYFLSLAKQDEWVKRILKLSNVNFDRALTRTYIADAGYDIKQTARIIESYYVGIVK